ncbi:DUF5693 family protein [Romboutsia lituseburensis]|uniref:DUF5693 family protein n=1 Tax=Romboutsia lituseburensis TaxID=1537 RepID=UPI00215AB698|nr:DUF5693 family protein [Romboutsia lituseburensis]MCR8745431.1 DUF5693 family protein [Romboutsia lituseburensis]
MKKSLKLIFSVLLIISVMGARPIIFERNKVEQSNDVYQFAIEAKGIKFITDDNARNDFYKELKDNDILSVSFNNLSLKEISGYRDIKYMSVGAYLEDKEKFDLKVKGFIPKYASKDEFIVMLSKQDFLDKEIEVIKHFLKGHKMMEDGNDLLFYIDEPIELSYKDNKSPNALITSKFFIDRKGIKEVTEAGLVPMLSICNSNDDNMQSILMAQILDLNKEFGVDKIQIDMDEVFGYPQNIAKFLEEFKKRNISIVTTEFQKNIGLNAYLNNGQQNIIRGHEIPLNTLKLSKDEFGARVARAVKERNMRVIMITDFMDYRNSNTINKSQRTIISNIKDAKSQLSKGYKCGIATSYDIMERLPKAEMFVALGSASIVGLLVLSLLNKNNLSIVTSLVFAIVTFVGAMLVNKLQIGIGIKAYAFGISILGACAAIVVPYKTKINSVIAKFAASAILATLSGLLVASIMYGTEYILKLKAFSGIKLLYILPPVLITLWVIIDSQVLKGINISKENLTQFKFNKQSIINMLKKIKWYHIVIVILVAVGAVVYIRRSGNSGNATQLELELRRLLEEFLYVRPRTKEFMLGYPTILMAYYLCKEKIKYSQYVLIPGAIATMSTVNTFTHLHTPIVYSLLRTVYGIILGLIVGLVYILIFKKIRQFITKER